MVYPIGDGTIHGGPPIPYYMKASVDTFVPTFGDTKLPPLSKADDTITVLEQSVGSFLQWPRCRISRILENTLTLKAKASQRKAAMLHPHWPHPILWLKKQHHCCRPYKHQHYWRPNKQKKHHRQWRMLEKLKKSWKKTREFRTCHF